MACGKVRLTTVPVAVDWSATAGSMRGMVVGALTTTVTAAMPLRAPSLAVNVRVITSLWVTVGASHVVLPNVGVPNTRRHLTPTNR